MAEPEVSLCGGRVVLAGFSHAQIRLVYLISSLSLFSMYTMSTLTPLLFSAVICTNLGHSEGDCFAHSGTVDKGVEDTISAQASDYMKYYETGEYLLQIVVLSVLSPLSDRVGRKKILILGILGVCLDAIGTALLARTPALVVAVHLLCSAFSGKYLVLAQLHAVVADHTTAENRSPVFMVLDASFHFGLLLAPLSAGGLASALRIHFNSYTLGLRAALATFGTLGLVTVMLAACWLDESLSGESQRAGLQASEGGQGTGAVGRLVRGVRGMAALLTSSTLMKGITITFGLVHFGIFGSDSLVELYASDQFRWEVLEWVSTTNGLCHLPVRCAA